MQIYFKSTQIHLQSTKVYSRSTKVYFPNYTKYTFKVHKYTIIYFQSTKVYSGSTKGYFQSTQMYFRNTKKVYFQSTKVYSRSTKVFYPSTKVYFQSTSILSNYTSILSKKKSLLWKYKSILWRKNPKNKVVESAIWFNWFTCTVWSMLVSFVRVFWCYHCSIWHFVLHELSWCHVTPKGAMPSSSAPKIHFPLNFTITWLMTYGRPWLQLTLAYPSRHCGHRGHCGHHIEGGQKGCYVRWIMKIPKLIYVLVFCCCWYWGIEKRWIGALLQKNFRIPWFRFQGWLVSRQERPTTSSSRVRQVPKAPGGFRRFRWFIRAHRLMEITFSKYMSNNTGAATLTGWL